MSLRGKGRILGLAGRRFAFTTLASCESCSFVFQCSGKLNLFRSDAELDLTIRFFGLPFDGDPAAAFAAPFGTFFAHSGSGSKALLETDLFMAFNRRSAVHSLPEQGGLTLGAKLPGAPP